MRANAPSGVRFCFPPMNGPGSMHSKLQLLKYKDYLRLVVPTGNLVPYDWGESGVMENVGTTWTAAHTRGDEPADVPGRWSSLSTYRGWAMPHITRQRSLAFN